MFFLGSQTLLCNGQNMCSHSDQKFQYSRFLYNNINIKMYSTIICCVVLHWLGVFGNILRRKTFESKTEKLTGGQRKQGASCFALFTQHYSSDNSKEGEMGKAFRMEKINADRIFLKKPERKKYLKSLGTDGFMMIIIIRLILQKWDGVEWNNLSKDMGRWQALVNMMMNLGVPQN